MPMKTRRTFEIKFIASNIRERVESDLTFDEIATQLANGWLIIGGMALNASIIEAVIEVEENQKE